MGRRPKTFSFMKTVHPKSTWAKHLQSCDTRCDKASPECIDYCLKHNIGKVRVEELCSNDKKGKDILL